MNATFRQHAVDCGVNLTGCSVVPTEEVAGCFVAHPVLDPETLETLYAPGTELCYGVGYVICQAAGPPVTTTMPRQALQPALAALKPRGARLPPSLTPPAPLAPL